MEMGSSSVVVSCSEKMTVSVMEADNLVMEWRQIADDPMELLSKEKISLTQAVARNAPPGRNVPSCVVRRKQDKDGQSMTPSFL